MIRALVVAALLLGAVVAWAAGTADSNALLEGKMPDDPARPLVQAKCLLCHSAEYLTSQRLTETQWQKTVDKMRKFGTPATDEEAKTITAYLARYWTQDLAPQRLVRSQAPSGK